MLKTCDFCNKPAKWTGSLTSDSFANTCDNHDWLLFNKVRLPLQGNRNRGREATVTLKLMINSESFAPCPCGHKQVIETYARGAYCSACGMRLKFENPMGLIMRNPELLDNDT